jgi:hypothetical protein
MKKSFVFALALIIGIFFAIPGFAQDKKQAEATTPAVQSETPARFQKTATEKKVTKKKHQKKKKLANPNASDQKR